MRTARVNIELAQQTSIHHRLCLFQLLAGINRFGLRKVRNVLAEIGQQSSCVESSAPRLATHNQRKYSSNSKKLLQRQLSGSVRLSIEKFGEQPRSTE